MANGIKLSDDEIQAAFAAGRWAEEYPPVLTIDQVAKLLQVPKATIYDWRSRGLLEKCSHKVGKHVRFFRDRLLKHVFNEGI
ncbi:MAG: helix-turn-helix domain-containing protein [Planctomycetaceae bacterium]|nr:helix-turn-helix domain-containing protein [Planctomycetaceae bacterium]